MKIVTHDSSFHTDDTFAVAVLLSLYPEAEVVRSRAQDVAETADFVVDTGMVYDPAKNRFDHHMPEGAGVRDNGIPYASFGLVWKEFGEKLTGGKREAEIIEERLVQPVDAHDNGVALAEAKFENIYEYTIDNFLYSYLKSGEKDPQKLYEVFMQNVGIAQKLLEREISWARDVAKGEVGVKEDYEKSEDKRIIETNEEDFIWKRVLPKLPEPLYVLYERKDGDWGIRAVPDITRPYGHNRKDLPTPWAGLQGEELQKVTGVSDAKFVHRNLFMAVARSKDGALELARLAVNS